MRLILKKRSNTLFRTLAVMLLLIAMIAESALPAAAASDGKTSAAVRWVMIGDSYSLARSTTGVTDPWTTLVDKAAGLDETFYSCASAAGFVSSGSTARAKVGTNSSYRTTLSTSLDFVGLLQLAGSEISSASERKKVKYILVCGGIGNDYRSGESMTTIGLAMKAFTTIAGRLFPNATIVYGAINWGIASSRRSYCRSRGASYYTKAKELGWKTLSGTTTALSGKETYFYFHTDNIHPTQTAQYLIADSILKALKSAGIIKSYNRYYASLIKTPKTYKITYDLDGGTVSGSNPTSYVQGFTGSFTLKKPVRLGYTFNGWTGTGLSSPTKTVTVNGTDLPVGSFTFKANWTKTVSVAYRTQVQRTGWTGYSQNGETSGTTGKSLRVESLWVRLYNQPYSGSVQARAHIQKKGWESSWSDSSLGKNAGTIGQSLRMEAVMLRLTGEMAKHYDIYYRVYCQKLGWLGWAKNGAKAGTSGYSYRIEAIQIRLVAKGGKAPGSTSRTYVVK